MWKGTTKALIQLESGDVVEAVGAERLDDLVTMGAAVVVYYDGDGEMLGWLLADLNIGVNLERSEGA